MESKLKAVQCHFTWDLDRCDIDDRQGISEKLPNRIKFCPSRYHALYFNILAFVSHLEGDNGTALGFLSEAEERLKGRKDDTELLVTYGNYAWVHYHSDNLEEVEVYLKKVEEITKTLPQKDILPIIHGQKGWTFLRLGASLYERSRESFEKALEGEPENVSHNAGYAVVLYRLEGMEKQFRVFRGESSRATIQLEKALNLEPDNTEVMVLLALKLQSEKRDRARALRLVTQALEMSSDVPQITRYVAKYFRMEGDERKSLEVLEKALDKIPTSSFLHHQIGLCHKHRLILLHQRSASAMEIRAQAEECIIHFSKAVDLKPSNTYARVNLAESFADAQHQREAERIFNELLRDKKVKEADVQHCQVAFGLFLMYKKKNIYAATEQFKAAYKVPIESSDRVKAGKKLEQLAQMMRNRGKGNESREIVEFLKIANKQTKESGTSKMATSARFKMAAGAADDLADTFGKGMKLK
ncbi:interferon-induced protein with tetratricopeptide repeats 1-like [Aplochiton taeniatus]